MEASMYCTAITKRGWRCTHAASEGRHTCIQHFNMANPAPNARDLKQQLEDLLGEIMYDSCMPPTDMPCKECGHHSPLITEHYVTKHIVDLVLAVVRDKVTPRPPTPRLCDYKDCKELSQNQDENYHGWCLDHLRGELGALDHEEI